MKYLWAWTGAGGLLAGLVGGWCLWSPVSAPVEPPAPSVRLAGGALVLERKPDATPPKPPHALPKGAKEERRVSVVVKPPKGTIFNPSEATLRHDGKADGVARPWSPATGNTLGNAGSIPAVASDSCDCPPVTVDLSLVRMPDKTRRVVASSPNGQILSGIDIPIESAKIPRSLPWAIGGTYSYDGAHRFGGFIDRDLGPFHLGVEAFQSQTGWTAQAKAGIRF